MKNNNLLVVLVISSLFQSSGVFAAEAAISLPSNVSEQDMQTLSERVKDMQNAAEARKEQSDVAKKALASSGQCGEGKTQADCINSQIAVDRARLDLAKSFEATSPDEQKKMDDQAAVLQQEISALQLQLRAPDTLNEQAKSFNEASGTLQEMMTNIKAGDFSWKEHFGVIGKALLTSWKDLVTSGAPLVAISAGMAGYGISRATSLNEDSKEYFAQHPTPAAANDIGNQVGYGYPVLAPFLIVALVKKDNDTMLTFDELAVGSAVNQLMVEPLKYIVREERPNGSDKLGFPSGHAAESFMMATILDHRYGHKVGILAYFAAAGVALIRAGQGMHSPGELMAGAGIGFASAFAAERAVESAWGEAEGVKHAYWKDALLGNFHVKGDKVIHCVPVVGDGLMGSCNMTW